MPAGCWRWKKAICRPRSSRHAQSLGYCDYKGGIAGPFTAHPKIDPVTGEMVFFGYNAAGPLTPALSFGSVNASGVVTRFDRLETPYASMVHDFIVTENHLLFPILPITGSMERAMRGRPPYAWEPEKGAYVGVMKRNGSAKDIAWFRAESCYVFHVMNAWEEADRIIADVMQFEEAPLFTHPDGSPTDPKKSRARLCRWTFDLAGNTDRFAQTYLDDITGEFPRIDDRHAGLASSHGWYACANPDLPTFGALSGIVHVDGKGKRLGNYLLPAGDTISEPVSSSAAARQAKATAGCSRWSGARKRTAAIWLSSTRGCRSGPGSAGASRPSRARRFSRQLGRGELGRKRKQSPASSFPDVHIGDMPLDASWPWRGRD